MECTRDTRRTVRTGTRVSTRAAALVAVAALLTGGVLAAAPAGPATPLAAPKSAANRAW